MTSQELHAAIRAHYQDRDPPYLPKIGELYKNRYDEDIIWLEGEFCLDTLRLIAMHMKNPDKQEY